MAVHSLPMPGGRVCATSSSIRRMASPELKPAAGKPITLDVGRPQSKSRVGLSVDLKHAAKFVELGDVIGAEISRQRREDLVYRYMQRLYLHAIDVDAKLRGEGAERR